MPPTGPEEVETMESVGSKYSEIGYQDLRAMCKRRKLALGRSPTIRELIKALELDDRDGASSAGPSGHMGTTEDSDGEGGNEQGTGGEDGESPPP